MTTITIEATKRKMGGKNEAKRIRREGNVPCVLYGGEEVLHFYAPANDFLPVLYSAELHKLIIKLDGKEYEALVKNAQFHPVTDDTLHIDFMELIPKKPVIARLPVHIHGTAAGVKEGGRMLQKIRKLSIKALPKNLRESIDFDVSELKIGESILVKEAEFEGIEFLDAPNAPIVSIAAPKQLKKLLETTVPETEEAEGVEGVPEGEATAEGTEVAAGAEDAAEGSEAKPEGSEEKKED